jgi:hypothetical protein
VLCGKQGAKNQPLEAKQRGAANVPLEAKQRGGRNVPLEAKQRGGRNVPLEAKQRGGRNVPLEAKQRGGKRSGATRRAEAAAAKVAAVVAELEAEGRAMDAALAALQEHAKLAELAKLSWPSEAELASWAERVQAERLEAERIHAYYVTDCTRALRCWWGGAAVCTSRVWVAGRGEVERAGTDCTTVRVLQFRAPCADRAVRSHFTQYPQRHPQRHPLLPARPHQAADHEPLARSYQ